MVKLASTIQFVLKHHSEVVGNGMMMSLPVQFHQHGLGLYLSTSVSPDNQLMGHCGQGLVAETFDLCQKVWQPYSHRKCGKQNRDLNPCPPDYSYTKFSEFKRMYE